MTNGYIIVARNRDDCGVRIEVVEEDIEEYLEERDMRIIYCQAVTEVDRIKNKIDRWLEENDDFNNRVEEDINDLIADMVSSLQWIANEHPLRSFHRLNDETNNHDDNNDDTHDHDDE